MYLKYLKRMGIIDEMDMQPYAKEFYEEITKKKPNKKTIPPLIIPYRLNKSITCKELEKVPSMDLEEIYRGKVIKWLGK